MNREDELSRKADPGIRRNLGILYQEESSKGLTHPFFILILNAVREEAEARGYDVTLIHHPLDGTEESLAGHVRRIGLDGLCLICTAFSRRKVSGDFSSS